MIINSTVCSKLRQDYREGIVIDQLAAEYDISEMVVKRHLRGRCTHKSEIAPVELKTTNVSLSECEAIREAFADGESPHDIADTENRNWHTIYNHLIGECSHEGGPIFADEEVLEWQPIPIGRCEEMRRRALEGEAVTEIAADSTWAYPTVLGHVNGECGHTNATVAPREKDGRAEGLGESDCRELRSAYAASGDVTIGDIISEYDISEKTAIRHIRYGCTHRAQGEIRKRIEDAGLDAWIGGRKAGGEDSVMPPSTSSPPLDAGSDNTSSSSTDRVDDTDSAEVTTSSTSSLNDLYHSTKEESTATATSNRETPSSRAVSSTSTSELDSNTTSDLREASKPASADSQASTDASNNETVGGAEETNTETDTATSPNSPASPIEERNPENNVDEATNRIDLSRTVFLAAKAHLGTDQDEIAVNQIESWTRDLVAAILREDDPEFADEVEVSSDTVSIELSEGIMPFVRARCEAAVGPNHPNVLVETAVRDALGLEPGATETVTVELPTELVRAAEIDEGVNLSNVIKKLAEELISDPRTEDGDADPETPEARLDAAIRKVMGSDWVQRSEES